MIINKLGNKTYTEHELRYLAQDEIARLYSPSSESNLQRKISGLALGMYQPTPEELAEIEAYKNHLVAVKTETAQASIDNQLLIDTIVYEESLVRLQHYELSVGRLEQVVYITDQITGEQSVDYVIPAIEPLPATIERTTYDEEGNAAIAEISNPIIVTDIEERAAAQSIIDSVSNEALALYELRHAND